MQKICWEWAGSEGFSEVFWVCVLGGGIDWKVTLTIILNECNRELLRDVMVPRACFVGFQGEKHGLHEA